MWRQAEDGRKRQRSPSKNSAFMARPRKDTVEEMRKEIEGKKRRDQDTRGGGRLGKSTE